MLFRIPTVRNSLVACAASLALAAGLAVSPADAASRDKLWRQQGSAPVHSRMADRIQRKGGRNLQPAPAQRSASPPAWPPQPAASAYAGRKRKGGANARYIAPAPQPPQYNRRRNQAGPGNGSARAPVPPAFVGKGRRAGQRAGVAPQPAPPALVGRDRRAGQRARVAPPPAPPALVGRDRRAGRQARVAPPQVPPAFIGRDRRGGHNVRIAPPPVYGGKDRRGGHNARVVPPPPPSHGGKDRRAGRNPRYAPPPVAGVAPRYGDDHRRGHHGGHRHYKHKHRRHVTHVTHHHVYRYYYYRTSPRHYYYINTYPRPYPYPVYYLVPYHVHTTPGYHSHGEETMYCGDGFVQGGVYRGGAYTRGASHQTGGAIIGGILGAAVGSQVGDGKGRLVAVGVGTVLGALIGSDVGRAMDRQDHAYATGSFGHAMDAVPSCTTITWNNPQSGNYGSVTPMHTYEPEPGRYCREFQQQVSIGGQLQNAYGTACRQPDGSWEIVTEQR